MPEPETFGIIAGNGAYPFAAAEGVRKAGTARIVVAAFEGETRPELAHHVDAIEWMRVGQLGRLIKYFKAQGVCRCMMAGQIAPKNLFDLRPDFRALLLLGKLRERNAESIFGAIADELAAAGVELLPATTFLQDHLAAEGLVAGPAPSRRAREDAAFGLRIAKEVSRLDIGQTVVVKNGTVLAVEAFEGTNEAMRRGGQLGRGDATMVKVSKPGQDFRFDVPVIGSHTLATAAEVGIRLIAIEAGRTLLLEREQIEAVAVREKISVLGLAP